MNELYYGLLTIIKSAVDKNPRTLPESFSLSDIEELIIKHQVVGMAYEGALLCGVSTQDSTMKRLLQRYYQQIVRNKKQIAALNELFAIFDANDIDYLPVKGLDMKALYPNPAMRPMGDADVLIRMEQYDRIYQLMQELGYTEGKQTGHELIWDISALHLELHSQLVSSYHPDLQRYYGDGWNRAKLLKGNQYTYSVEDMYIFLFAHFVKHYRKGGIGVRHVLDIWLYTKANPTIDMSYVLRELEQLRLREFHNNVCAVIECWFGDGIPNDRTEFMSEFILNSGSWGNVENVWRFTALREKKQQKKGNNKRFFELVFPGLEYMQQRFPVLYKFPWLLPIIWPIRWLKVFLFKHEKISKNRRILKHSRSKEINEYEAALHYVGLHYDF